MPDDLIEYQSNEYTKKIKELGFEIRYSQPEKGEIEFFFRYEGINKLTRKLPVSEVTSKDQKAFVEDCKHLLWHLDGTWEKIRLNNQNQLL